MNILEDKIITTRKTHKCFGCAREFKPKSKLQLLVHVDSGDFSKTYWCETCRKYWQKFMSHDDEIFMGDLKREDFERWEQIRKELETL